MHQGHTVTTHAEREDALLLREFGHRAMNDFAVARSAVAVARRAAGDGGRDRVLWALDEAGARLDGVAGTLRLLAAPVPPSVELGAQLATLCRSAVAARPEAAAATLDLSLPETWIDGATARRLTLIVAELVANACRHGLANEGGKLGVALRRSGRELVVEVSDDGSGRTAAAAGTGFGRGIVAGLAQLAGGTVSLERHAGGATATVRVPLARGREMSRAH